MYGKLFLCDVMLPAESFQLAGLKEKQIIVKKGVSWDTAYILNFKQQGSIDKIFGYFIMLIPHKRCSVYAEFVCQSVNSQTRMKSDKAYLISRIFLLLKIPISDIIFVTLAAHYMNRASFSL